MTVYLDLVMVLNFLVDLMLLLGTNRLAGFPPGGKRCLAAALLGSIYSGVCLLPDFRFLGNALWRTVCMFLMTVMAFGLNPGALRRGGLFLLLSMALGGIAMSVGTDNMPALILCAGVLWLLCRLGFGGDGTGKRYVPVTVSWGDRQISVVALQDTGNTLRDPVTGEQVLVLSAHAAKRLTGLSGEQLRSPLETLTLSPVPGLRLIPYKGAGGTGMLLGMRFEKVTVAEKTQSAVIAFAPEDFGRGEIYQALAGGSAV